MATIMHASVSEILSGIFIQSKPATDGSCVCIGTSWSTETVRVESLPMWVVRVGGQDFLSNTIILHFFISK